MHKSILVTGANGQLGSEFRKLASRYDGYCFTFIDRSELDLTDEKAIEAYFSEKSFDAVINCAAYTAVDKAESEAQTADAVNHLAVKTLASVAKAQNMALVHISTDYVFDGMGCRPYKEDDPVNPGNVYGKTKRDGERAMLEADLPRSAIIRTSWVYSSFGANFLKTMLRLGQEREELGVIFDQVGTPTYALDLAEAVMEMLPKLDTERTEVLHYSNEGVCSWYDFAKAIFEIGGIACRVKPIETSQYPTPASRPPYSLLNKNKIKTMYGIEIPYWRDSLRACMNQLAKEQR